MIGAIAHTWTDCVLRRGSTPLKRSQTSNTRDLFTSKENGQATARSHGEKPGRSWRLEVTMAHRGREAATYTRGRHARVGWEKRSVSSRVSKAGPLPSLR